MKFYIFTIENIKYTLYIINMFLYFTTLYIINLIFHSLKPCSCAQSAPVPECNFALGRVFGNVSGVWGICIRYHICSYFPLDHFVLKKKLMRDAWHILLEIIV